MAEHGKLGVVTVTYNSANVIGEFLQCCLSQSFRNFVLVILDNASTDRTCEMIEEQKDSRVLLLRNPANLGVAAANNQGINACLADGCDALLLINNDTVFDTHL